MDKPGLMDADVDKNNKGPDIGHDARKLHSRFYILYFFNPFRESEDLELLTRIAAGFGEYRQDIIQRRKAHLIRDVLHEIDSLPELLVAPQIQHRAAQIPCHGIDNGVALRMDRTSIQRVF